MPLKLARVSCALFVIVCAPIVTVWYALAGLLRGVREAVDDIRSAWQIALK